MYTEYTRQVTFESFQNLWIFPFSYVISKNYELKLKSRNISKTKTTKFVIDLITIVLHKFNNHNCSQSFFGVVSKYVNTILIKNLPILK